MTREELRAHLKASAFEMIRDNGTCADCVCKFANGCGCSDSMAEWAMTAIESSGLAIVPVEMTIDMTIKATEDWLCERAMEDRAEAMWRGALSANPLKPHE